MTTKWMTHAGLVALTLLWTNACQTGGVSETTEIESRTVGDVVVSLESESGELTQGQNRFVVAFRSAGSGEPVDPGTVTVGSSMSMPGMAPMVAPIDARPAGETGRYSVEGTFGMSGAWNFEVSWDGPAGRGSTAFSASVR